MSTCGHILRDAYVILASHFKDRDKSSTPRCDSTGRSRAPLADRTYDRMVPNVSKRCVAAFACINLQAAASAAELQKEKSMLEASKTCRVIEEL